MNILGVVGGIGSGKSLVTQLLAQSRGAVRLDADRIGHEVLRQPAVKEAIYARFGDAVFDPAFELSDEINRRKLAAVVFSLTEQGADGLAFLNNLTHPRITEEFRRTLAELEYQRVSRVVLDAPLLFEARWNEFTTGVIFVDAPEPVRWNRCEQRGWSRAEFLAREAAQWPTGKKREHADYILPNAGTLADLENEVRKFPGSLSPNFGF